MFQAKVFLAGPSRQDKREVEGDWSFWQPQVLMPVPELVHAIRNVYIADAGIESFLQWYDSLKLQGADALQNIVWCGDGDSLGKHRLEILRQTSARFEGRWREHLFSIDKDFSDGASLTALMTADVRHSAETVKQAWFTVHGACGGRFDHELVNIFEFAVMLSRFPCPATVVIGPERVLTTAPVVLSLPLQRKFSILAGFPNQEVRIRISGARYSGEFVLKHPSHGLSNVSVSEKILIEPLSPGVPLIGLIS